MNEFKQVGNTDDPIGGGNFRFLEEAPPEAYQEKVVLEPAAKTDEKPIEEQPIAETPAEVIVAEKKPEAEMAAKPAIEEAKPELVIPETQPDFTTLLGEATKGAIKNPEELNQALEQLRQLREDAQKPKYKSPQEEKIAQFLAEYPGQDFGTSFQMYLKLNSLDVKSLDPASAIKEAMILDNMKLGLTSAESEQLAVEEIENKYGNDANGLNQKRDSILAKQKLEALQQESKAPTANPQQEAERQQREAQQQRATQVRADYISKTEEAFKKAPEPIKIKVSDDPKEELTLKPYDAKDATGKRINPVDLKPLVENYDESMVYGRYAIKNEKGELIGFNPALIKQDLEKIHSFEQRIKEAVEHGIHIGTERYMKERSNNKVPVLNSNGANGVAGSKAGTWSFPNGI